MTQDKTTESDAALTDIHQHIVNARADIARADAKAGLLAAAVAPFGAVLIAAPALTSLRGPASFLTWLAATSVLVGIVFLGGVVWPRLDGQGGYLQLARLSKKQIAQMMLRASENPEARREAALQELEFVSHLAVIKFTRFRRSIVFFGLAAALALVAGSVLTFFD